MWHGCAMVNSQYPLRPPAWTYATAPFHPWTHVAYHNGVWVAVSYDGYMARSTNDGANWTEVTPPELNQWSGVCGGDDGAGNHVFIAVATSGTNRIAVSSDAGVTWTMVAAPEANAWTAIAWGNSTFVAVATSGTNRSMWSNDNGTTWHAVATNQQNSWVSIAYGGGTFVMVSPDGATYYAGHSTDNGQSWGNSFIFANTWYGITYDSVNSQHIAVASAYSAYSGDGGASWNGTSSFVLTEGAGVAAGDGVAVAVSPTGTNRGSRTSNSGATWAAVPFPITVPARIIGYGNGVFVAGTDNGYIFRSTNDAVNYGDIFQYSVDAIRRLGFDTSMSYANSGFALDYHDQVWDNSPTTFKTLLQSTPYQYLFDSDIQQHFIQLWTFTNGTQSDPPVINVTAAQLANEYAEVYAGAVYLLQTYADKEFILKNWEGDWQLLNGFDPAVNVPSYRAERYAAFARVRQQAVRDARHNTPSSATVKYCVEVNRVLDDSGYRLHRDVLPLVNPDMVGWSAYEAINFWYEGWTRQAPDIHFSGSNIKGFATDGSGGFVVVSTAGKVSYSLDNATTWYPVNAGFSSSDVNGICYVSSIHTYVAVGNGGKIATSTDGGRSWTQQTSGTAVNLNGVVTDPYTPVIFGDTHTLLWSFDMTTWTSTNYVGGAPTTNYVCGYCDVANSLYAFGGTNGKIVYSSGVSSIDVSSGASFGANTVRAITSVGARFVAGGDSGKMATSANFFGTPWVSQTSQFGTDAVLGLATKYSTSRVLAVGANGKISTSDDGGQTWTARTAGTGASLNACTYSATEGAFAYGCDGATGYSLDGITWVVNGQGNMGGLNVNPGCMLSANAMTLTGANSGTLTTGAFWHIQKNAEHNADFYLRDGVARIRRHIKAGTPVAITEYGFPQDQSNFTGVGLDVAGLIQRVIDTATALNLEGVIWWQIFDNEEQSPGVPRGFHLYNRNGNATTPGSLSAAGVKYQSIL